MRQRITVEDLKSLTPSQQEKLRELWQPQRHDVTAILRDGVFYEQDAIIDLNLGGQFCFPDDCDFYIGVKEWHDKTDYLPLLNIGQCIELLESESCYLVTDNEKGKNKYSVIQYDSWAGRHDGVVVDREDLIVALWEAVKSIL